MKWKRLPKLIAAATGPRTGATTVFTEREQMTAVASVAEAQAYLPFAVRVPQQLGTPALVAATPQQRAAAGHFAIVFRYDDPSGAQVTVMEQSGDMVATVRGGIPAIVEVSETGAFARWIEGGVLFTVIAPGRTRDELLAIVERV